MELYESNATSMYDYTGSGYAFVNWTQVLGDDSTLKTLAQQAADNPLTSSPFEHVRAQQLLEYLNNDTAHGPQVEIVFSEGYTGVTGYPAASSPLYGSGFFTLIASVQHPFSLGSVHITFSRNFNYTAINPNYLAQEYDIQAAVAAAKYLRKIANTEPLSGAWTTEYEPGLDVVGTGIDADAQWRDYVTNNTLTIYHPAGTCAMLPLSQHGVVDPNLIVYGTRNLGVVDGSVIPILMSAHPQTLIYGISEIAAEKIIKSWV